MTFDNKTLNRDNGNRYFSLIILKMKIENSLWLYENQRTNFKRLLLFMSTLRWMWR